MPRDHFRDEVGSVWRTIATSHLCFQATILSSTSASTRINTVSRSFHRRARNGTTAPKTFGPLRWWYYLRYLSTTLLFLDPSLLSPPYRLYRTLDPRVTRFGGRLDQSFGSSGECPTHWSPFDELERLVPKGVDNLLLPPLIRIGSLSIFLISLI